MTGCWPPSRANSKRSSALDDSGLHSLPHRPTLGGQASAIPPQYLLGPIGEGRAWPYWSGTALWKGAPKSPPTRPYCISGNRLIITDLLWISPLHSPHYIPLFETESTGPFGTLADVTIGTIRPDRMATTGPLSEPTIPDSPQTAGPAVPERGIGPGGVSGCSAMPGSAKVQPARQSSRIQGGQDIVERHDGLRLVMEKVVQWEQ